MILTELEKYINLYAANKEKEKQIKSQIDKLNKSIKKYLTDEGIDEYSGECYTVSKTEINADKLDEAALIIKLKELYPEVAEQVVHTIDILDLDKLEDLLYNRVIEADVVNSCVVHRSPTIRLNIKENKGEEDGSNGD